MFEKSFTDWLEQAQSSNWALPHFNVSTGDQLKAIIETCAELESPVIIGLSEGEVDFMGYEIARGLVDMWRELSGLPIFLNADHHKSLERAKQAIESGFDGVNIDLSLKSDMDNIAETKAVVDYAKSSRHRVNIEGEIGALPTQSSEVNQMDIRVEESSLTTPDQARNFVNLTGVDRLTPAVGNFHGLVAPGNTPKKINLERIKAIKEVVDLPLTLHGGSGLGEEDLMAAAEMFSNIHINTELRVAYTEEIRENILETTTPYKYLAPALEATKRVVEEKIKIFGSAGRAS